MPSCPAHPLERGFVINGIMLTSECLKDLRAHLKDRSARERERNGHEFTEGTRPCVAEAFVGIVRLGKAQVPTGRVLHQPGLGNAVG